MLVGYNRFTFLLTVSSNCHDVIQHLGDVSSPGGGWSPADRDIPFNLRLYIEIKVHIMSSWWYNITYLWQSHTTCTYKFRCKVVNFGINYPYVKIALFWYRCTPFVLRKLQIDWKNVFIDRKMTFKCHFLITKIRMSTENKTLNHGYSSVCKMYLFVRWQMYTYIYILFRFFTL